MPQHSRLGSEEGDLLTRSQATSHSHVAAGFAATHPQRRRTLPEQQHSSTLASSDEAKQGDSQDQWLRTPLEYHLEEKNTTEVSHDVGHLNHGFPTGLKLSRHSIAAADVHTHLHQKAPG